MINMNKIFSINSRLLKRWRLLFLLIVFSGSVTGSLYAHQSPNSLIFLDISPERVAMEIQLPVPELELAFGNDISKDPETIIERFGPQLKEYLNAHIHAYINKGEPWLVEISSLKMDKGKYIENGIAYWEVNAQVILRPQAGESTRKFMLDYDVIMHQVINHVALLSIRNDWESGTFSKSTAEPAIIGRNTKDNVIYPLEINLENGSWWTGFKSMIDLGIQHIKEGTDHLLFIIVLLLVAPIIAIGNKWKDFGGIKYTLGRIIKIATAFTIGHSITLLAGAIGWLRLPSQPVEILIAVSILVSAIHAYRPLFFGKEIFVASGFGLIHGLAFANVLANLNLDTGSMALSILGFNIGIELMQLFVIAIIIPWLIVLSCTRYYSWIRIPGAVLAAMAALAWITERITGKANFITGTIQNLNPYFGWMIGLLAIVSIGIYFFSKTKRKILLKIEI